MENAIMDNTILDSTTIETHNTKTEFLRGNKSTKPGRISLEREISLTKAMFENGDKDARDELITEHLSLVIFLAKQLSGYGIPLDELIQEGNVGLLKAIKRFDPSRGVRFCYFSSHYIKAEMNEFIIKNLNIIKIATTKPQRKLFFNLRRLMNVYNHLPIQHQFVVIAKDLGVTVEEARHMSERFAEKPVSFSTFNESESALTEDGSPEHYLSDNTVSDDGQAFEDIHAEQKVKTLHYAMLTQLNEKERKVIQSRHLSKGDCPTFAEIGEELGVSCQRIAQIEAKAFNKLSQWLH
jgi:RNA polymerase sigma-32 factor